jgi:hypothetical protein
MWIRAHSIIPGEDRATLKVVPSEVTASVGESFTVNIDIAGLLPELHVVGIEFEIAFDSSILEVVEVLEGDFAQQFGDTFFIVHVEDNVLVGELQLPPYPGDEGWMRGSGTVATIEFTALATGSSELTLEDARMVNADAEVVPFDKLENGFANIV